MNFSLSPYTAAVRTMLLLVWLLLFYFYLSFWPCTFRIFDFVLRPMWNWTQCWRTACGIVIDVLLLNYVHIMIFIVCACSESTPCLRMRVCIHDTWCLFHVRLYRVWSVRRSSFHMKKNQTNFFRIEWLYLFIWLLMEFDPQSTYGWADGLRLTVTLHVESINCACRCAECIGSTWIFSHVFEHMWNSIDLIGISAGR